MCRNFLFWLILCHAFMYKVLDTTKCSLFFSPEVYIWLLVSKVVMVVHFPFVTTWTHSQKGGFLLDNYLIGASSHCDTEIEQAKIMYPPSNQVMCSHCLDVYKKYFCNQKKCESFYSWQPKIVRIWHHKEEEMQI